MPQGTHEAGDVILRTLDGRDLSDFWTSFSESLGVQNATRERLTNLFTFGTTLPGEEVEQAVTGVDFEESSEFGEPVGVKPGPAPLTLGFSFKDFDLGKRYTWKFLRDATTAQVEASHDMVLESDNRNEFLRSLAALFNNVDRTNKEGLTVKPLWNNDAVVPPPFQGNVFLGTHNHYMFSGVVDVFDPGDVDALLNTVREHGYGIAGSGTTLLLLINPAQEPFVRALRAGQGTPVAAADFIPSASAPPYLSATEIVGQPVAGSFNGEPVIGSYGDALVISSFLIPASYMVALASGGPNSPRNPVGFREHPSPSYRGLLLVEGPRPDYPLLDAFYLRSFGTGIRHRGGAARDEGCGQLHGACAVCSGLIMNRVPTPEEIAAHVELHSKLEPVRAFLRMAWPNNRHYVESPTPIDQVVSRKMERFLMNPPDDGYAVLQPGTAYIVWLAGSFTPIPLNVDIDDLARRNAPWLAECDRCDRTGHSDDDDPNSKSLLLTPVDFWLFGFVLCPRCSYEIGQNAGTYLIAKEN